jgi:DNA repair exonuclease SbcCD nuclease subunit
LAVTSGSQSKFSSTGITLLAIGDVHLGTRQASLPANLTDWGVEPRELTPEAALGAAIDLAITKQVSAVLFAGDVVESTNARFEALRPLEDAVRRLAEAGIPVLGVAGNHDVDALPRLADRIEGFTLLGKGGHWESQVIEKNGRPVVEIVGWSFPERVVRNSPLADLLRSPLEPRRAGLPRIGLLHGDLDATGGVYAPFSRREIDETGLDAWLLGHIHKPSLGDSSGAATSVLCGYLGSLVGLDPSETGLHGPWLIRVERTGQLVPEQQPIAPLRWEPIEVLVEEEEDLEDLADRLLDEAERLARKIAEGGSDPKALGVRVRLVGPTRHFDAIRHRIEEGTWNNIARAVGDTVVFVNKVIDQLTLATSLEEIATGDDPPALMARKLIALDRGDEEGLALLELARSALRDTGEDTRWNPLETIRDAENPLSDDALRSALKQAGTAALNTLLSQRQAGGGESS